MIIYAEVPPELEKLDIQCKETGRRIKQLLDGKGTSTTLINGTNLFDDAKSFLFYVNKGIFKYYYQEKLVRLYEAGDCILADPLIRSPEFRCLSEFGADITTFTGDEVTASMVASPTLCAQFLTLNALQSSLLHTLCALLSDDEFQRELSFLSYPAGALIIAEGEPAHEIYMLVQGTAKVTVKQCEVGVIKPGEVFGEISFFTKTTRTATVTAASACLVQVMNKDDFISLVKRKPSVNYAISKTLSERLVATNQKISNQHL